jgi:hypothetical protein
MSLATHTTRRPPLGRPSNRTRSITAVMPMGRYRTSTGTAGVGTPGSASASSRCSSPPVATTSCPCSPDCTPSREGAAIPEARSPTPGCTSEVRPAQADPSAGPIPGAGRARCATGTREPMPRDAQAVALIRCERSSIPRGGTAVERMRQRNIEVARIFFVGLVGRTAQGGRDPASVERLPGSRCGRNIHLRWARGVRYEGKTERQLDVPGSPFKLGLHPLKPSGAHVEALAVTHLRRARPGRDHQRQNRSNADQRRAAFARGTTYAKNRLSVIFVAQPSTISAGV